MKNAWNKHPFQDCIEDVTYTRKVPRQDFLGDGTYPIVSQEEAFINGYWNNEADLFRVTTPIVVFGDHTKTLKYVDFDFVLGADGVKILQPRQFLVPKFFFYQLQTADLGFLGYARHYKLLRALEISVPSHSEQQRIVGVLDEVFEGISTAKANAEKNLQNARALFENQLQSLFTLRGEGWAERRLHEVSKEFGRGKSKHRPRGDLKLLGGNYPLIQTGDIGNSTHWIDDYSQTYNEVGFAQSKLWPKGTVCLAIVGANVAETAILTFDACFPDSVIGIVVNDSLANNEYVEYLLQFFKVVLKEKGKGTARDNLNLGTFENQKFPFPDLPIQKAIVSQLNYLNEETQRLESIYQQKLAALEALKKSFLHQAFTGAL